MLTDRPRIFWGPWGLSGLIYIIFIRTINLCLNEVFTPPGGYRCFVGRPAVKYSPRHACRRCWYDVPQRTRTPVETDFRQPLNCNVGALQPPSPPIEIDERRMPSPELHSRANCLSQINITKYCTSTTVKCHFSATESDHEQRRNRHRRVLGLPDQG